MDYPTKAKRRTILIDGIRYYEDRPESCRKCFFWKNRKVGCILGEQNCYYLAEAVMTEQEKKCEGCCYAKGRPCVSAPIIARTSSIAPVSSAGASMETGRMSSVKSLSAETNIPEVRW